MHEIEPSDQLVFSISLHMLPLQYRAFMHMLSLHLFTRMVLWASSHPGTASWCAGQILQPPPVHRTGAWTRQLLHPMHGRAIYWDWAARCRNIGRRPLRWAAFLCCSFDWQGQQGCLWDARSHQQRPLYQHEGNSPLGTVEETEAGRRRCCCWLAAAHESRLPEIHWVSHRV